MKKALELGCGDLNEANSLTDYAVLAIDKKITGTPLPHVTAIEGDYFDIELEDRYDLIYAHYTLCFNERTRIESRLPHILSHLADGGTLIIKDFSKVEKIVIKRTNLDDEWFFEFLHRHVGRFSVSREQIYDKKHNHAHDILTIIGVKKRKHAI